MNIATLARKYLSNGNPACTSSGYGLYKFSGNVKYFTNWLCEYPDKALANYGQVLNAYRINSKKFKAQWHEIGTVDPGNFGKLQDEYIKLKFYNPTAEKLDKEEFYLIKHHDALKAVALSLSLQNGSKKCTEIFKIAAERLGYPELRHIDNAYFDGDLISSIYDYLIVECDLSRPDGDGIWHSPDNFCQGSKNGIAKLRQRFVSERSDALALLTGATI